MAEQGFADFTALGAKLLVPQMCAAMARICALAGAIDKGLARVAEGLAMSRQTGERFVDSELLRMRGELALLRDDGGKDSAKADFRQAMDFSESQEIKALTLRAAASLARLLQADGHPDEARLVLTPVHAWFTEGFETADLVGAKALLDDLK